MWQNVFFPEFIYTQLQTAARLAHLMLIARIKAIFISGRVRESASLQSAFYITLNEFVLAHPTDDYQMLYPITQMILITGQLSGRGLANGIIAYCSQNELTDLLDINFDQGIYLRYCDSDLL